MNLNYKLAKESMLNGEDYNHIQLQVKGQPQKQKSRKTPVALMLLIDNSGSMGMPLNRNWGRNTDYLSQPMFTTTNHTGQYIDTYQKKSIEPRESKSKLHYAKQSAIKIIDSLQEGDYFGIVMFDDLAHTVIPLTQVKDNKDSFINKVNGIHTGGMTNMYDGFRHIENELKKVENKDVMKKMMVLSDGDVNSGVKDMASFAEKSYSLFKNQKLHISTIGFGTDYNIELLSLIAKKGEGELYHLKEAEKIYDIIEKELKVINSIIARETVLKVKTPIGMTIGENLNYYNEEHNADTITISFGNMYSNKSVIFPIELLKKIKDKHIKLSVSVEFINHENQKVVIEEVVHIPVVDDVELIKENKSFIEELQDYIHRKEMMNATVEIEKTGGYHSASTTMEASLNELSTKYNYTDINATQYTTSLDTTLSNQSNDVDNLRNLNSKIFNSLKNDDESLS